MKKKIDKDLLDDLTNICPKCGNHEWRRFNRYCRRCGSQTVRQYKYARCYCGNRLRLDVLKSKNETHCTCCGRNKLEGIQLRNEWIKSRPEWLLNIKYGLIPDWIGWLIIMTIVALIAICEIFLWNM